MLESLPIYSSQQIVERRPQRNKLDPRRPYSLFVEKEQNSAGEIIDVATLFLRTDSLGSRTITVCSRNQTL